MNWKYQKLADVCVINPSKKELEDISRQSEVSFLPMKAVSEEGIIINQEKRKIKDVIKGFTYFKDNDVLLAKITPCFENGKRTIAKDLLNGIGFGSTEFHVLRPKDMVTTRWIFYAVTQEDFRNNAKSQMTGTAGQKRVPKRVLEEYQIPIPVIHEQEKITEEIETQFTRLDSAIKTLNAIKKKLDVYRKSVLKAAFEGRLIPFELISKEQLISDYCKKVRQLNPKSEDFDSFLYIDISSIDNKKNKIVYPKEIKSDKAPSRAKQETFPGDIVYSTVRVYLMNVALVPAFGDKQIISSTGFTVLRTNKKLNSKFLFYYLLSVYVTNKLNSKQRGTSYPAIRDNDLFEMTIKVPKVEIQERVVQEIESRFSVVGKLEQTVDKALLKSNQLRKSILKSAFEGKLVKYEGDNNG